MASGIVATAVGTTTPCGRRLLLAGRLDEARPLARARWSNHSPAVTPGSGPTRCTCSATSRPIPTGRCRGGEAHYREALTLAEPRGMRPLVAHCHLGLGKLSRRTGKREQAREHLTTASALYREMDMRFWLEQAAMATTELA